MNAKQYIIISAYELGYGAGCWSNQLGWTTLDLATRFDESEIPSLSLPLTANGDAMWLGLPAQACDTDYLTRAILFQQQVAHCVNSMLQNDARGQVLIMERKSGTLESRTVLPTEVDITWLERYELVIFDGGNTSGDSWKQIFHPAQLVAQYINENPLPAQPDVTLTVSLDGGQTYQPASAGVRLIYKDVMIDGEDGKGELHINATHEGLITDVWCFDHDGNDVNIGTESKTVDELITRLVSENA